MWWTFLFLDYINRFSTFNVNKKKNENKWKKYKWVYQKIRMKEQPKMNFVFILCFILFIKWKSVAFRFHLKSFFSSWALLSYAKHLFFVECASDTKTHHLHKKREWINNNNEKLRKNIFFISKLRRKEFISTTT